MKPVEFRKTILESEINSIKKELDVLILHRKMVPEGEEREEIDSRIDWLNDELVDAENTYKEIG